ncbi:MAG TPA: phosphodiesterase, partial [Nitrolancea sp.]|nr:phosphodiesterase [Nitrolancea sp.]
SYMLTSRDPDELGFYGFRNRRNYSYDGLSFADSRSLTIDRLWDHLGHAGKHVTLLVVPQTYPPAPVAGELVSCF